MFELIKNNNHVDVFDNLFNSLMSNSYKSNDSYFSTDDKFYRIDIALPGASKKDIQLTISNNYINLNYDSKNNNNIWNNSFERKIKLPNDILENNITAELKDGILSIIIARDIELTKSKFIKIK
tara:strand:- start:399 stop:770 length:372 start_codon:yes stop_codon:yes gene_type:complete